MNYKIFPEHADAHVTVLSFKDIVDEDRSFAALRNILAVPYGVFEGGISLRRRLKSTPFSTRRVKHSTRE